MLDVNSHMMAVQLDQRAADIYEKEFDKRGVHQIYNTGIKEALKDDDGGSGN